MNNQIFLLVDDDEDDCAFFCEAVSKIDSSVKCLTAFNGEDALYKLRININSLPHFIFMDLNMPCMDGKQCLRELKKDVQLKHIPVIIFSTSSSPRDVKETLKLGAAYFITKPVTLTKLQEEITHVMETDWLSAVQAKAFLE